MLLSAPNPFLRRRRDQSQSESPSPSSVTENNSSTALRPRSAVVSARFFRSLIYIIALVFVILVEVGNVSNKPVLRDIYFLKIDLSEIIPLSVPDAALINSIARSIGLHDFYQVGLWNFCEGYEDGSGITYCSPPKTLYSFNPVDILMDELLSGATIALPGEINSALDLARIASNWMFVLFLVSAILIFLCIILAPFSVPSTTTSLPQASVSKPIQPEKATFKTPIPKRLALPLTALTFITFIATLAASVVATALFTVFKIVFANNAANLNVSAELGVHMLVFMWIAVAFVLLGFVMQCYELCSCCCCLCSRRQKKRRMFKQFVKEQKRTGQCNRNEAVKHEMHQRQPYYPPGLDANRDWADVAEDARRESQSLQQDGLHGLGRIRV
ncbi:hypothetical protein VTO42DRAFT_7883 [Malbranchea cinnamomea]